MRLAACRSVELVSLAGATYEVLAVATRYQSGGLPDGVIMTCGDDVFARLRGDYPAWDITRAGGQWLATRERVLFEVEMSYGLRHVLIADSAGQLRDALAAQHALEMGVSRELA